MVIDITTTEAMEETCYVLVGTKELGRVSCEIYEHLRSDTLSGAFPETNQMIERLNAAIDNLHRSFLKELVMTDPVLGNQTPFRIVE